MAFFDAVKTKRPGDCGVGQDGWTKGEKRPRSVLDPNKLARNLGGLTFLVNCPLDQAREKG